MPPRNLSGGMSFGGTHAIFHNRINQGQGIAFLTNPVAALLRQEGHQMSRAAIHRTDHVPRTGASSMDAVRPGGTFNGLQGDIKERQAEMKEQAEGGKKTLPPEDVVERYRQINLGLSKEEAKKDHKIRKAKKKRLERQVDSSSDDTNQDSDDDYDMQPSSPIKHKHKKNKVEHRYKSSKKKGKKRQYPLLH